MFYRRQVFSQHECRELANSANIFEYICVIRLFVSLALKIFRYENAIDSAESPLDITFSLKYNALRLVSGPVAQLGARLNRTEEVRGSNPLRSTRQ